MKSKSMKMLGDIEIPRIIKKQAKENKEVIFGSQAISHQVFNPIARPAGDYDLFSPFPRKSARQLERSLDENAGGDWFYTKRAIHPKTFKVMDKGLDGRRGTKDDFGVADYSPMPRGLKTTLIGRNRFVRLSHVVKTKKKAIRDPKYEFRHEKDRDDLERIKLGKRFRRRTGF